MPEALTSGRTTQNSASDGSDSATMLSIRAPICTEERSLENTTSSTRPMLTSR